MRIVPRLGEGATSACGSATNSSSCIVFKTFVDILINANRFRTQKGGEITIQWHLGPVGRTPP